MQCNVAPWVERILRTEGAGGEPKSIRVVAPSIVGPNEEFSLRVAVTDGQGLPASLSQDVELNILAWGADRPVPCRFEAGRVPVSEIRQQSISREGIYRFAGQVGESFFFSNPVWCTGSTEERIFWGDPHIHTVLGGCHYEEARSLNFCYTAGRYLSALDWVAAADHVSNGRCDPVRWKEQRCVGEHFNAPLSFVTLPAYEASLKGGAGGDNNVYLSHPTKDFVDEYEEGNVKTLVEGLERVTSGGGIDFFVVPHHPTRTGKHGEIPASIYPGEARMPAVEIHSKWGTSEYRGNLNPLREVHPGPSYAVDLLRQGYRLGFMGGTDTHTTLTFCDPALEPGHIDRLPGMTAVIAPRLERSSIFAALKERSCYAVSGERILVWPRIDGSGPGRTRQWDGNPRRVEVTAATRTCIDSIELVRNGTTIQTAEVGDWKETVSFVDEDDLETCWLSSSQSEEFAFYYIRVNCSSGAQAWTSPIWYTTR